MQKPRPRWTILTLGLVFVLLLALATPAAAGRPVDPASLQRLNWYTVIDGSSDNVTDVRMPGHVTINTPNGRVAMVINGQITLLPNTTYWVWVRELTGYTGNRLAEYAPLNYYKLATFTTNVRGQGSFHINVARADLANATRNIQIAVNSAPSAAEIGTTVAATVKFTPVQSG